MRKIFLVLLWVAALFCLSMTSSLIAQEKSPTGFKTKAEYYQYLCKERGDSDDSLEKIMGFEDRKKSILDVGNVEARIRNSGTLGYDRDFKCYEFPAASGITYRWVMAPIIGYIAGDGTKVFCDATYGAVRGHQDEFEPLEGLDAGWSDAPLNNYGIAASDRPDTWPDVWPTDYLMPQVGSDGFPGVLNGEVIATRELYFAARDDGNNQFPGNIRIDCWCVQYANGEYEDFLIFKIRVTNVGYERVNSVYIGIHDDPDTPEQGNNEWEDDYAAFIAYGADVPGYTTSQDSLLWDFVYLWDGNDRSDGYIPSNVPWAGLKVLDTPINPATGDRMGITTLDVFPYYDVPQTEITSYDQLASGIESPHNVTPHPGDYTQTPNSYGPDITFVIASGPFDLDPGESVDFSVASIHGINKNDLFTNAMQCQTLFNSYFEEGPPTGVKDNSFEQPDTYSILQNYPNPFNSTTVIKYYLPERAQVDIKIYDVSGREIATVTNEKQPAGYNTAQWNGKNISGQTVAGGIYFYRFRAGSNLKTGKMIFLK